MPRLVITGVGQDKRSAVVLDGPISAYKDYPEYQGIRISDLWKSGSLPTPLEIPHAANTHTVGPNVDAGSAGFNVRHIVFPPRGDYALHTTPTIDFAVVLSGEIVAVLENGETALHAGDIFIQRATQHGWRNPTERPCSMLLFIASAK
ncbi:cupin domain-containing protein [Bordetella sp. H567]|uniref:cupin domain-containing protein n=1 Tax=Bordetella sp. H567 TaxID=1697043 RepID=UPI000835423A|nr:cupin domain-containing protein [Bordetella sp. H567]